MKLFSMKWKAPKRQANKLEEKKVSEDLLGQIAGGLAKGACHTANML